MSYPKRGIEILGYEAKALPILAAAIAWQEFAKNLEAMGSVENLRTVRFWDLIVSYYGAYAKGLHQWQSEGMPVVDVILPSPTTPTASASDSSTSPAAPGSA